MESFTFSQNLQIEVNIRGAFQALSEVLLLEKSVTVASI